MHLVCLDLEGVLVPEIWIAFAEATGIHELKKTTRDEPNYNKLMRERLEILDKNGFKLSDIQRVISTLEPLEGAVDFAWKARKVCQLAILSDTFEEFASPLMEKLGYPLLFCNSLEVSADGKITGFTLRQEDGKRKAVRALRGLNVKVFAAGDSYNDLGMIEEADAGALFRAPEAIKKERLEVPSYESYGELLKAIEDFARLT